MAALLSCALLIGSCASEAIYWEIPPDMNDAERAAFGESNLHGIARGDGRTLFKQLARRVVRVLKRRGLTKLQVQAYFGNLYDAVTIGGD